MVRERSKPRLPEPGGTNVIQDGSGFKAAKKYTAMNVIEIIKQLAGQITKTDLVICLTGLILLGIWLFKTSLGRDALAHSPPRRNNMPAYLPFIPMFVWLGGTPLAVSIRKKVSLEMSDWQYVFLDNLICCIFGTAAMIVIICLARNTFARRLKGFGLNVKTVHKDFFAAAVNLLSVWPLVLLMLMLTMFLGQLILGPEFKIEQHEELKRITAHPQLSLRILIVVTAVVVAPLIEEMLFRGLFQTMIRSFLEASPLCQSFLNRTPLPCTVGSDSQGRNVPAPAWASNGAWLAIVISSGLFAAVHYEPAHWPALFVLAVGLGYSYEKSGSLFRPVFMHSLFNATTIVFALRNA